MCDKEEEDCKEHPHDDNWTCWIAQRHLVFITPFVFD